MISEMDMGAWEKLVSGQSGFILATIIFGLFYWRVLLPRQDALMNSLKENTQAVSDLAKSVNLLMLYELERRGAKPSDIMEKLQ